MESSRSFYTYNQYSFIIQHLTEIPSFETQVCLQDALQFGLPGATAVSASHTRLLKAWTAWLLSERKGDHFRQNYASMMGREEEATGKEASMNPKSLRIIVWKVLLNGNGGRMRSTLCKPGDGFVQLMSWVSLPGVDCVKKKCPAQWDARRTDAVSTVSHRHRPLGDVLLCQHLQNGLSSEVPWRVWLFLREGEPHFLSPFRINWNGKT